MLNLQGEELGQDDELMPIYKHPKHFDEGAGLERAGKSYIVVSQDGTGDCDNLREAYSQLNKAGGKIFIKDGTYILKSTLPMWKNNVSIEGSGSSTIIQGNGISPLISISGANIKFSGCYLKDTSGTIQTGSRLMDISGSTLIKIDKCYFDGFDSPLMLRGGSNQCTISNCQIDRSAGYGIYLIKASNNIIENNTIKTSECENFIYLTTNSNNNIINKNLLDANGDMYVGIFVNGNQNIISNNQISNFQTYGVQIFTGSDSNIITENFFKGNILNFIDSGTNTQIGHNTTA